MRILLVFVIILLSTGCGSSSIKLNINSEKVQSLYNMATPIEDATILKNLYDNPNKQNEVIKSISKNIVEEYVYKIFGDNISVKHEKVYVLSGDYCGFDYNEELQQYEFLHGCSGNMNEKFYRKITSAIEEDDKIIILEKSLYVYYNFDSEISHITIYNNIIDRDIIQTYDVDSQKNMDINIDDYLDHASTYQYVFKKVEDHYIFDHFTLLDNI